MYWKLFIIFAKIGAFTLGGGVAMIPLIEREVVYKHKWIDDEDFLDMISIAQSAPGLIAVNVAIFIGHRIAGIRGSIVATIGSVVPPFIIILLVAAVFTTFKDNAAVQAVFKGIRPAVVALIAAPVIRMAIKNRLNWITGAIAVAATVLIAFLKISPIWIIIAAIFGGLVMAFNRQYAMLSLIQNQVVTVHQWLTPEEFTDIVAISQMSPGPIGINSATYIGYSVPHAMGFSPAISVLGSLTATIAVVLPSYLLVLWICILFERFKNNPWFASILKIMRPVTIGMIAAAAIILITPYNFIDWWSWALFAAAFIALLLKANPIWIIIAAGGAGYLIYG